MALIFAIIIRELNGWPRRKRFYLKRLFLVFISSLGFLGFYFESAWSNSSISTHDLGRNTFEFLAIISILVATLASPVISSSFFAREKEHRTLGLLLITEATPFQLVFGRFIMSIVSNFISIIAIWPILLLCIRHDSNSLSFNHVFAFSLIILSTVLVGTTIGLLVSTMMMEEKQAFFVSIALGAIYFVAVPVLIHLFAQEIAWDWINEKLLPAFSPIHALQLLLEKNINLMLINFGGSCLVSAFFFFIAVKLLPIEALRSPHDIDPKHAEIAASIQRNRKPIKGNPLTWKERPQHSSLLFVFSVVISALIPMPWGIKISNPLLAMGLGLFVACILVVGIGLIVKGALAFVQEKESRTFELLLISDLSEEEIIIGKYWGYISSYLPWFPVLIFSFIFMYMAHPSNEIIFAFLMFITICFCNLNMAILLSLKFRRIMALILSFFAYAFWILLSTYLILNLNEFYFYLIIGFILINLFAGVVLFELIFREFKHFAKNEMYLNHHQWMN